MKNNPELTIRKMDMSDVPYVFEIEKEAFQDGLEKKMLYDEILHNTMAHYFMALKNEKRVGYYGLWHTDPGAQILNLVVEKAYRNKGIGTKLLSHAIQFCEEKKIRNLTLEVRPSNKAAIALYDHHGFIIAAKRKNYYKDGEDAYLMNLELGVKP
ncbi:MAG: ribosomal protein S18-alanine N-acetyltransferase [Bacillota bacterium]